MATRTIMKRGKPMSVNYKTPIAKRYQKDFTEYVNKEVEQQGWGLVPNKTQHFYVDAVFYFNRIDMDANNYWKCLLDAITDTQKIWIDDNVVCERVNGIFYDDTNPRVELVIKPVEYIGIFENSSHLDSFISRCVGCKRYTRNCSIFRRAKEGRIQEEIQDGVCLKYSKKNERK